MVGNRDRLKMNEKSNQCPKKIFEKSSRKPKDVLLKRTLKIQEDQNTRFCFLEANYKDTRGGSSLFQITVCICAIFVFTNETITEKINW